MPALDVAALSVAELGQLEENEVGAMAEGTDGADVLKPNRLDACRKVCI
jgi:hypothetical protein